MDGDPTRAPHAVYLQPCSLGAYQENRSFLKKKDRPRSVTRSRESSLPVQGIESVMAAQWIGDPSSRKLVFVGAAGLAEEA